jgi:hypothetical protein
MDTLPFIIDGSTAIVQHQQVVESYLPCWRKERDVLLFHPQLRTLYLVFLFFLLSRYAVLVDFCELRISFHKNLRRLESV